MIKRITMILFCAILVFAQAPINVVNDPVNSRVNVSIHALASVNGDATPAQRIVGAGTVTASTASGTTTVNGTGVAAIAAGSGISVTPTGGGNFTITNTAPGGGAVVAVKSINGDTAAAQNITGGTGITVTNTGNGGHTIATSGTLTAGLVVNAVTGSSGKFAIWQTGPTCTTNQANSYDVCVSNMGIPGSPFTSGFQVVCSPGSIGGGKPHLVTVGPNGTNVVFVAVMNGTANGATNAYFNFLTCFAFGT
jgi:hypothetical protein